MPGRYREGGCDFGCRLCETRGRARGKFARRHVKRAAKRAEKRAWRGEEADERAYVSRLWAQDWDSPEDSAWDEE